MKSARLIGEVLGLTAREVNVKLKEIGFLKGKPGNYDLTEEGQKHGRLSGDNNGYGGYAYKSWGYAVWDNEVVDILKSKMKKEG